MKLSRFRLVFLVALAVLAFGCNGKNVAVVNPDIVFQQSAAGEKGNEYLKGLSTEMQATYEAAQEKIKNAKGKEAKAAAESEMQQALVEMQQRLNAEQQQVVTLLTDAYKKAIENSRLKGKYDIVIPSEAALSYDPKVDITQQVLSEMNAMPVEFTPIKPEAAQPEEAKDQPAQQ